MCRCTCTCVYIVCFHVHLGALIGFTNLGEINRHLAAYESQVAGDRVETEVLAHSMLVIMVRGLFSKLTFPYAQFPCSALSGTNTCICMYMCMCVCVFQYTLYNSTCTCTYMYMLVRYKSVIHNAVHHAGDQMFDPMWEAVCRLERLGLKVLGVCCDGLAANRSLFNLHNCGSNMYFV